MKQIMWNVASLPSSSEYPLRLRLIENHLATLYQIHSNIIIIVGSFLLTDHRGACSGLVWFSTLPHSGCPKP